MTLRRIVRMLLLGLGAWAVIAAIGAVIVGRGIRHADRMARVREPLVAQLDDPLRRAGVIGGDPTGNAGGAILALSYATTEPEARKWLATCARRGVPQATRDELWRQWQVEHTPTRLHPDPKDHT